MVFRAEPVQAQLLRLEEVVSGLAYLTRIEPAVLRTSVRDRWAVERGLQLGAEIILDIGNHILGARFGVSAEDHEDILEQLARHGVVSEELHRRLKGLGKFRNLLVYDYMRLDVDRILESLARAPAEFSEVAAAIRCWLAEESLV